MKLSHWWLVIVVLLFSACAKVGSPTGGSKDTSAPKLNDANPENGSVNFNQNYFDVRFDEYVQLNNIQQNLIVSPPFSEKPKVRIKGKGFRVILPETPKENTTYSFSFLNAISDITEQNKLPAFIYAFSTGNVIDSLEIHGKVMDAFTNKPVENVYVLLYHKGEDTVFQTSQPDYLTLSNANGEFSLSFLAYGEYNMYALQDANYSYTFDQPNEKIAFLDSIIIPKVEMIYDTTDSVSNLRYYPDNIELRLFEQKSKKQYINHSSRPLAHLIKIGFNNPIDSAFYIESPNFTLDDIRVDTTENNDSLNVWILNPALAKQDSLQIRLKYFTHVDTIGWITDTLVLAKPENEKQKLQLSSNLIKQNLHHFEDFRLISASLIQSVDSAGFHFYHVLNDSTEHRQNYSLKISKNTLELHFISKLIEGEAYRFVVDSSAITDIAGHKNDSMEFHFEYRKLSSYSELKLNLSTQDKPMFCELLKGDELIDSRKPENSMIHFMYLEPGKYSVRLIWDENENEQWDTGKFNDKIQPEYVKYYPQEIELRANWQQEIDWILSE
jgi:hypothetical protein